MLMLAWAEVEIQGSWSLVFLQSFLVGLTGAAVGLMVGSLSHHVMEAVFAMLCFVMSCVYMSGVREDNYIVGIETYRHVQV
jgi:hypothetical protein